MRRDLNVKFYVGKADEISELTQPGDFFRDEDTGSLSLIDEQGNPIGVGAKSYKEVVIETYLGFSADQVIKSRVILDETGGDIASQLQQDIPFPSASIVALQSQSFADLGARFDVTTAPLYIAGNGTVLYLEISNVFNNNYQFNLRAKQLGSGNNINFDSISEAPLIFISSYKFFDKE